MWQNQRDARRYSPRHYRDRERQYADTWSAIRPLGYLILILVYTLCVVVSVLLLVQPREKYNSASHSAGYMPDYSPVPATSDATVTEPTSPDTHSAGAEPGILLESGSNLEDNFYAVCDRTGGVMDFTSSSFVMPGYINGNALIPDLTVHYGPGTVVKKAVLSSENDTYEIYASSLREFEDTYALSGTEFMVGVIFENPDAQEPQAKEIRIIAMKTPELPGTSGNQGATTATATPVPQTGTLIASGNNIKENVFAGVDRTGNVFDLTESTFVSCGYIVGNTFVCVRQAEM